MHCTFRGFINDTITSTTHAEYLTRLSKSGWYGAWLDDTEPVKKDEVIITKAVVPNYVENA